MNSFFRYGIFFVIAAGLTFGAYLLGQNAGLQNRSFGQSNNSNTVAGGTELVLTYSEVARHSRQSDCWLIISGKVYNATNWVALHPGGPEKIIPNCGKDATQPFSTKDGTGVIHSSTALTILRGLYVGDLGSTVTR